MSAPTLFSSKPAKTTIRRAVRKEYREGDQIGFVTKSFTNDKDEYHPALDVRTGEWSCTCPAAHFHPHKPCKHTVRAAQNAVRSGDAEPSLLIRLGVKCCFKCMGVNELSPMCHEDGTQMPDVFICQCCVTALNAEAAHAAKIEALRREEAKLEAELRQLQKLNHPRYAARIKTISDRLEEIEAWLIWE